MFANVGFAEIMTILLVISVFGSIFVVLPHWFIFRKAGFHPALSLLMLIPVAGVIMRFFLAFADWPSLDKTKRVDT